MSPPHLPIETLPAWALLNNISFTNVEVQEITGKGFGLVCERDLSTKPDSTLETTQTLLTIPRDLILNVEAVEEYAKEDKNFKQLLDVAGHGVFTPFPPNQNNYLTASRPPEEQSSSSSSSKQPSPPEHLMNPPAPRIVILPQ